MNNISTLEGTIYSKELKTWPSKKPGEPPMEFNYLKLEFAVTDAGRTITCISEFLTKMGLGLEGYDQGDSVSIDYYPFGKELKKKDGSGSWWKEEKKIVFIKHADINTKDSTHKGKIKIDPSETESEKFFVPRPSAPVADDYNDDLPF
jgi:hypothetical protein